MSARRAWLVAAGALVTLGATAPGPAPGGEPPLPAAPVTMRVAPATLREGRPARIHLSLRADPGAEARRPVDVYVVRLDLEGGDRTSYLAPDGGWRESPVPLARDVPAERIAPLVVEWRESGLPGRIRLNVEFVRPAADPRQHQSRVAEPAWTEVAVAAPPPTRSRGLLLVGLGLLTVAALASVLRLSDATPGAHARDDAAPR